jgi:ion channel-forming bestrophin family protein
LLPDTCLYASAIGIIVGFRNNLAYSRWWEARTLWGQIVNGSRNLALLACEMTSSTGEIKAAQRQIVYHQIGYVRALRNQLRGLDPLECLHDLRLDAADQLAGENNVALALGRRIGGILATLSEKGWINPWQWQAANSTLRDLIAAQGGTERIKNTPLPKQYDLFLTFVVVMYCMLLPVGMVEGLGWLTPLGSTAVVFIFLALDRIGRNLEAPFDNRVYDGPLTAITNNVDINLRQVLGDKDLPVIEQPIRGVLW